MQLFFPDCMPVTMQETVTLLHWRAHNSNVAAPLFHYDSLFLLSIFATPEKWAAIFCHFEPLKLDWLVSGLPIVPEMVGQWASR